MSSWRTWDHFLTFYVSARDSVRKRLSPQQSVSELTPDKLRGNADHMRTERASSHRQSVASFWTGTLHSRRMLLLWRFSLPLLVLLPYRLNPLGTWRRQRKTKGTSTLFFTNGALNLGQPIILALIPLHWRLDDAFA